MTSAPIARVALDVPIAPWFDYDVPGELASSLRSGSWVVVPWGRGRRIGIVLERAHESPIEDARRRPVAAVLADAPVPPPAWLALARFAAGYYHRHVGEVLMPALPKLLREPPSPRARGSAIARARSRAGVLLRPAPGSAAESNDPPALTAAQADALAALTATTGFAVHLLHGITGSGKTEVYLRWLATILARDPAAQVLLLVPEIALTPQLAQSVRARFAGEPVAVLHSGLAEGERASMWLAAADGQARVVIGTRLAVLAPLPHLAAIVVDEEHDPSFKQQEGVHYSARDLAIVAARHGGFPVVLGSATPSLESWLAARSGRYRLLDLPERASGAKLPALRLARPGPASARHGLGEVAVSAVRDTLARGEQALVFLNRRGYAPVLSCPACGWLSQCDHCAAYRVLHRATPSRPAPSAPGPSRYQLVCHHCGAETRVPRACPVCGEVDLQPLGRGTQRIEEALAEAFPQARIARLDRDVARRRGAAQEVIDAVHAGDVNLLVGTQMLAKGHDFRRLALVVVVDADAGLYAADFRAPERLFATLMQVAGRAGRGGGAGEVIVQTRFPDHPLFGALIAHDFPGFADALLAERREAALPPYRFQALLRAEATDAAVALGFLADAKAALEIGPSGPVRAFDPVPMPLARLAGRARAQLLLESPSRPALHRALDAWLPALDGLARQVRWQLDVDPLEI